MPTSQDILKNKMLECLEKSLGVVHTASKMAGIARSTHYDWMKNDPEYKEKVDDLANVALDITESKLHELIDNGEVAPIIFYLKTKGKARGYVEKTEQEVTISKPIIIDWTDQTTSDSETKGGTPGTA